MSCLSGISLSSAPGRLRVRRELRGAEAWGGFCGLMDRFLHRPHSLLTLSLHLLLTGPDGQIVRLIAVPSFHRDPTLVLVNLRTLECRPISFKGFCDEGDEGKEAEAAAGSKAAEEGDAGMVLG